MTTAPKARKFRIRRSDALRPPPSGDAPARDETRAAPARAYAPDELLAAPAEPEDGFGDLALPGSAAATRRAAAPEQAEPAAPRSLEDEIAAIRAEGLTGRQLRMARRTAQKHGLTPTSDFDAVRLLRGRGIDPFAQSNMLELVVDDALGPEAEERSANLPATTRAAPLPAQPAPARPAPLTADARAAEIMKVQRDIARRRRKRLFLLATRLSFFVLLPTLLVAYYYYRVATPLYATHTEFVIQKAESGGAAAGGLGSLFGGTSFATVQESIVVQSYLESREAMLRLDQELGFRAHFSSEQMDPLLRLAPDAPDEAVYATYRDQLTIGYDPTEGVVKVEMLAADPTTSQAFSEALIRYAEERVDQMSQRLREDQMAGARDSYEDAERRVTEAQTRVLELQERRGVLSADAEVSTIFQQISTFELELQNERLRLAEIMAARAPNATRVQVAEANIGRLEALIASLRSGLTEGEVGGASLARIQSELVIAQADLETRQMMLAQALQQLESARIEANRQSLYLSIGVYPVAPDEAAYPRAFENTLLAFLVFSGIYLMVSMTATILREQVSS
ncbi:capsule biosynthesis protein [Roseicyclus persicicus]|uniref:Capsule biosynthesis protein n=1 Tax=Roseicyclus persicicus TaxID=2650661 RepID=A0A7X6JV96_9RHOB|nr:capsule biosynthesis protein [Roseibacterium persicicum]NKX43107.1 capsule biosynthesis protein [Roseibacterium persicicum]